MTIKVANDGYRGVVTTGGGVMLIGGVLHEMVRPVSHGDVLWVPVRNYEGPVQYVDRHGDPIASADEPDPASGRDGRGRGAS